MSIGFQKFQNCRCGYHPCYLIIGSPETDTRIRDVASVENALNSGAFLGAHNKQA